MKLLVFLFLGFFLSDSCYAQSPEKIERAWKRLYKKDQVHPTERTDASTQSNLRDACNLILKYGYPDFEDLAIAKTPILCFIHCEDISFIFPAYSLIYRGYQNGLIDTMQMANYVSRSLHKALFDRNSQKFTNAKKAAFFVSEFHRLVTTYLEKDSGHFQPCESCYAKFLEHYALPSDTLSMRGEHIGDYILDKDPFYWRVKSKKALILSLYKYKGNLYYKVKDFQNGFKLTKETEMNDNHYGSVCYQFPPFISSSSLSIGKNDNGEEELIIKVGSKKYFFRTSGIK